MKLHVGICFRVSVKATLKQWIELKLNFYLAWRKIFYQQKVLLSLNNLRKLNILKHKSSFGRIESRKYDIAFRNLVSGTKEFTRWFQKVEQLAVIVRANEMCTQVWRGESLQSFTSGAGLGWAGQMASCAGTGEKGSLN